MVQMSGEGSCAGILVGGTQCPVINCGVMSGGSVTVTGDYSTAGGIVRDASSEIINCFSQAAVTSAGEGGMVGGICGSTFKAYNCYTPGSYEHNPPNSTRAEISAIRRRFFEMNA